MISAFILLINALLQIILAFFGSMVASSIGVSISDSLFYRTLKAENSKIENGLGWNLIFLMLSETQRLTQLVIQPLFSLASKLIVSFFMIFTVFLLAPGFSLLACFFAIILYLSLYKVLRPRLIANGKTVSEAYNNRFEIAKDTLDGRLDVEQFDLACLFHSRYQKHGKSLSSAQGKAVAQSLFPRYVVELCVLTSIIVLFLYAAKSDDGQFDFSVIAMLALLGLRILPSLQSIFISLTQIIGNWAALESVDSLSQNLTIKIPEIQLEKNEQLHNVSQNSKINLISAKNLSIDTDGRKLEFDGELELRSCKIHHITGDSGVGKTTLLNVISGRDKFQGGNIFYNNEKRSINLKSEVCYISQSPHIFKNTIAFNICFKNTNLETDELLTKALFFSGLDNEFPNKSTIYQKTINEDFKISGGQAQRVAIARAIYSQRPWLFIDEGTNALDEFAENEIFNKLLLEKRTIVFTSHNRALSSFADTEINLFSSGIDDKVWVQQKWKN